MDGFRGHVFVSEDNATVVISIKGTSAGWLVGGSGPTAKKDKLNGTLLFRYSVAPFHHSIAFSLAFFDS
jgi:putative lipase involved disintegration of autophagic bodies